MTHQVSPISSEAGGARSPLEVEEAPVVENSDDAETSAAVRVVAVGASAGGIEAFEQLLAAVPAETGLAWVLVQHLDASHGSMLASILQKSSAVPVRQAEEGARVEPDHVYVIPPDRELTIAGGVLRLKPRPAKVPHRPIDRFFTSLASDQKSHAIGVVLSGADTDGSAGLQSIRDVSGITFAQDDSAIFEVMPRSASTAADFVLSPGEIGEHIVRLAGSADAEETQENRPEDITRVFRLLRERFDVDFGQYKAPSIHRRILRRVLLDGHGTVERYARALASKDEQLDVLYQDLLIGVTAFFRDPKQFAALRDSIFPEILEQRQSGPLRIWVAGCSTGEEVYSLMITLFESLRDSDVHVTIFGTDINDKALEVARAGVYSEKALANVSPELRERFFTPVPAGFRISKKVRELCVFAKHDVTSDPPYSNIDLVMCCNLLIYLGTDLQNKALSSLHYALVPDGFLGLGDAESLRTSAMFAPAEVRPWFYRKLPFRDAALSRFQGQRDAPSQRSPESPAESLSPESPHHEADLFLAGYLAPCGVLVDASMEIVRFRGDVEPYLRHIPGEANLNLFGLIRHPEMLAELRPALHRAGEEGGEVLRTGIAVEEAGERRTDSFRIIPFPRRIGPTMFWVLFSTRSTTEESDAGKATDEQVSEVVSLRASLSAAVQDRERLADEAASAAEEAQSSDEELRSTNEELETAKEELQSANEELITLNGELLDRNATLTTMNDDLENVLSAIEIPMLFVGIGGEIRRFNAPAAALFRLDADNRGRSLSEVRGEIVGTDDLPRLFREAIKSRTPGNHEVRDESGRWRLLRIHPYLTSEGVIDGGLIVVSDIDALKRSLLAAEKSARLSTLLADAGALLASSLDYETTLDSLTRLAVPDFADWCAIDLLDGDGSIRHLAVSHANPFMRDIAEKFQEIAWDERTAPLPSARPAAFREPILISEISSSGSAGGEKEMRYNQLVGALGLKSLIRVPLKTRDRTFGTMTFSMSEMTYDEDDLKFANELGRHAAMAIDTALLFREREAANRYLHALLGTVAHEIRTPLTTILGWTALAAQNPDELETSRDAVTQIDQSAKLLRVFVDDLLDTERIAQRKLRVEKEDIDLKNVVRAGVDITRPMAEARSIRLTLKTHRSRIAFHGDQARLIQVVWNLVSNAIKFTPAGGTIEVELKRDGAEARLSVGDTGKGIESTLLPHVFKLYHQDDRESGRASGLGIGLAIAREVVTLHGGSIQAESEGPGKGSTFTVIFPIEQRRRKGYRKRKEK
jgi:two-component system, chemotaxis family, CheB/CheR fusion protein